MQCTSSITMSPGRPDQRHDRASELGVGEPLGRDEQQVDLIGAQRFVQLPNRGGARALLIVVQRRPRRVAASIWFRISANSGEISRVGPAPAREGGGC
ncbi:MAG: hypothetical protein R2705_19265 [Ilumatobacteraceae bacterium]